MIVVHDLGAFVKIWFTQTIAVLHMYLHILSGSSLKVTLISFYWLFDCSDWILARQTKYNLRNCMSVACEITKSWIPQNPGQKGANIMLRITTWQFSQSWLWWRYYIDLSVCPAVGRLCCKLLCVCRVSPVPLVKTALKGKMEPR